MTHRASFVTALLPFLFAACGTIDRWQEVQSGPMPQADVYDALDYIARAGGYAPAPECDRGLGTWQSRWRSRQLGGIGRPGRFRLRAEIMLDEGKPDIGWTVRYLIEQQKVKDLKRSMDPVEDDWSGDGQDSEREYLFGQALRMRLGVKPGQERPQSKAPAGIPSKSR